MNYNNFMSNGSYGLECIIDLHNCDKNTLTVNSLQEFVKQLLEVANMEAYGPIRVWEDHESQEPHIQGNAVFQWITTSHIMVYALTLTNLVMINLFSCKDFNVDDVLKLSKNYFKSEKESLTRVDRGCRIIEKEK